MKKIQIEKGCPSVNISLTMFHSCLVVKWVSPSYQRHSDFFTYFFLFFTFFLTHIGSHSPLLQGYSLWKSLQSFFDLCGLYVASNVVKGFKGFWKKGYEGSKDCVWVFLLFYNKIINLILWKTVQAFTEIIFCPCYYFLSPVTNILLLVISSLIW